MLYETGLYSLQQRSWPVFTYTCKFTVGSFFLLLFCCICDNFFLSCMCCITFSFEGFMGAPKWASTSPKPWWGWKLKALIFRFVWQLWSISGIRNSSRDGNKQFLTVFKIYLYQALHHFDFMIHVFTEIYRTILIASSCFRLTYPSRYWQNLNLLLH